MCLGTVSSQPSAHQLLTASPPTREPPAGRRKARFLRGLARFSPFVSCSSPPCPRDDPTLTCALGLKPPLDHGQGWQRTGAATALPPLLSVTPARPSLGGPASLSCHSPHSSFRSSPSLLSAAPPWGVGAFFLFLFRFVFLSSFSFFLQGEGGEEGGNQKFCPEKGKVRFEKGQTGKVEVVLAEC